MPRECQRVGRIAFTAVEPLTTVTIEAVATRYRAVYGVPVDVLPAVPEAVARPAWNTERGQFEVSALATAVARHHRLGPPDAWVIAITDIDLFWKERQWRYSFSTWSSPVGIVSTARTEPGEARSSSRLYKLISRMLAETYCGLERGGPNDSLLRPTLMGLEDLDAIDETVWSRGPSVF